jgi:hypothetical protein
MNKRFAKTRAGLLVFALCLGVLPAQASDAGPLQFVAELTGKGFPAQTGSAATGQAVLTLHPDRQAIDFSLDVKGLTREGLWDQLVKAPVGPMHVHLYLPNGEVVLIMAFPYGKAYRATAQGFRVRVLRMPYRDNAALVQSMRSFDEFVAALRSGQAYLNLHTDRFNQGEIAGQLKELGSG